ncbi:MAG: CehA/McbA family metallohydrolase [Candidatus Delongbacteria bacterium]|nr:CehA/McbA family metallohydrolase [Candidatus Delongbacteria bacterium]
MELDLLPLIALYPEIHYRFKYFPFSLYFKKEPEIIIDLPYKTINNNLPLFILIKDADKFPIRLHAVKFSFYFENGTHFAKTYLIKKDINEKFYCRSFHFEFEDIKGVANVEAEMQVTINGQQKIYINDNLNKINTELKVYIDDNEELFEGFIQGDMHYHSQYTSDQVEFGAPLTITRDCSESLGLNFVCVTDHSYDLDDDPDNYLKKDTDTPLFKEMKAVCEDLTDEDVNFIAGEEITVKNKKDRNVHLLSLNNKDFFFGEGDSAERWLNTSSSNTIEDIFDKADENTLLIAAHPLNKVPLLEHFLIKRGVWSDDDLKNKDLKLLQILNGEFDEDFEAGKSKWIEMLLTGRNVFIVAGNDAHGNFNLFRQIKFPMFKLINENKQIFGRCRTVVKAESNSTENIFSSVNNGLSYITNGPHVNFIITDGSETEYTYGDEIILREGDVELNFKVRSSEFSGQIKKILVFRGDLHSTAENIIYEKTPNADVFEFENTLEVPEDKVSCYYRIEINSVYQYPDGEISDNYAVTNPIWVIRS